jgi:hypothetical protein
VTGELVGRDLHDAQDLAHEWHLRRERIWGRGAVALVIGVGGASLERRAHIEARGDVIRLLFLEQFDQHRRESVDRVRVRSIRSGEIFREGIEGAERERMPVQ